MGDPVRLVSLKLDHRVLREARLISLFRIALSFSERRVSEDDMIIFAVAPASASKRPAAFRRAVRLAIERQSGLRDGVAHPSTETIDSEGLAVSSRNDHDVLHVISVERFDSLAMQDMRTWQVERRKRTRHLIELGGLVVKAGLVD